MAEAAASAAPPAPIAPASGGRRPGSVKALSLRLLPLTLLAAMAAIGVVVERARYETLLWASKVPLVLLLALAFGRARRR
jgi:hypothetical protein